MGRNPSLLRLDGNGNENGKNNTINNSSDNNSNTNDQGFYSIRDRFPLKRNPGPTGTEPNNFSLLERPLVRTRPQFNRKGLLLFPFRDIYLFYFFDIFLGFCFRCGVNGDAEFNYGNGV